MPSVCVCVCVCVCVWCVQICAPDPELEALGKKIYTWRNAQQRTGMVLEFKVAKAGNTRRAHRRCMHGLRTEGELRRNGLGRGLVVKDKCDLVLIHAC